VCSLHLSEREEGRSGKREEGGKREEREEKRERRRKSEREGETGGEMFQPEHLREGKETHALSH